MIGNSLKLDAEWDLCLDRFGNIATVQGDAAICQDVGCALKLFTNDAYFEPNKGIDYFHIALGVKPFESLVRSELSKAAMAVNGVLDVELTNYKITKSRELSLSMRCLVTSGKVKQLDLTNLPLKRGNK